MQIQQKTIEHDEAYLRQVSRAVEPSENYQEDIEKLREFCRGTEYFALAAVQIGIPKRIVYLKNTTLEVAPEETDYDEARVLINPVVISRRGKTKFWEACVSCLNNTGLVTRPYEIRVQYYDEDWVEQEKTFRGLQQRYWRTNWTIWMVFCIWMWQKKFCSWIKQNVRCYEKKSLMW